MSATDLMNDPARAWEPYRPDADAPWDRPRVAHLHRRAGFAAPWPTQERDLKDGPEASVARLLDGEPATADGQPAAAFAAEMDRMARRLAGSGGLTRMQAVWLRRMIFTPHPLHERMTLFWHDHFATSNSKVGNLGLMQAQQDLIRRHALGDFKALLREMARDPAMLIWLDSASNRKAHPNENYAREVMELFTLGRGNYTEKDIREAARAFTGSFVRGDRFIHVAAQHDDGIKTVLGKTGPLRGNDIAAILLEQPACAEFLCTKLFAHFVSEVDAPSPALIAPLAEALRRADYDIKAPLRMILQSRLFFDPAMRRRRVKSPVEMTVGAIRALEILKPTVSADALAESTAAMGQSLLAPPSVAGWEWGAAWINTTTSLARSNFALALMSESDDALGGRVDPKELAERHGASADPTTFLIELLVQDAFDEPVRARMKGTPREVATLILTSPEFQLA